MNINERQRDRRREHTPGGAMTALFKEKGRSNRERSRLLRLAKGKNVKRGSNPQSDEPDREDSQTMLDIKDKIAETLLNSFNELLNEGGKPVSREGAGVRSREENNQRNKKEESLDYTHNDRFDELSDELVKRAEKAATKKDKEHSKISSDARKVGAKDTSIDHRIISDAKGTQARRFRQRLAGDRRRPTNPDTYRARKRANRRYHQAKQDVGIGTRTVPVSKR